MFAIKLSDEFNALSGNRADHWLFNVDDQLRPEGEISPWMRSVDALGKNGLQLFVKLACQITGGEASALCLDVNGNADCYVQTGFSPSSRFANRGPDQITLRSVGPTAILDPIWPEALEVKFKVYLGIPIEVNGTVIGTLSVASNDLTIANKSNALVLEHIAQILALTLGVQSRVFDSNREVEESHNQIRQLTAYAKILQDQHLTLQQKEEELGRLNVRLQDLADTDGLTGLLNHRACYEILLDRFRSGLPTSLLIIDLDNFKSYNDDFGHVEGDALLAGISGLIKKIAGEDHPVCRYGGEELAVIVKSNDENVAIALADRMKSAVTNFPFKTRPVTFTAGIAVLDPTIKSVEDLVRHADQALYAGKRSGKNKILAWNGY